MGEAARKRIMVTKSYVPDRGDIVWLDFEPTKGHEQKGFRPAFVVSPKMYNVKIGLLLACPITSEKKGYPFKVPCDSLKVKGVILADHVRSVDWRARHAKYIMSVPSSITHEVEARLLSLIQSQ